MKTAKIVGHWGRWGASAPGIQNLPKGAKFVHDELQIDKEAFEDAQSLARIAYSLGHASGCTKLGEAYWAAAMLELKAAYSTKS